MKNTFLFTYSTNALVRFVNTDKELSYPKHQKMCDPILVTLLKLLPHHSKSSCESATPSSGTSPLAPYKEVPPLPRDTGVMPVSYRPVLSPVPSNSSRSLGESNPTPVFSSFSKVASC